MTPKDKLTAWLPVGDTRNLGIWDMLDRVSTPSVFGYVDIIIIWDSGPRIIDDVLEHRTELDSVEDFRFLGSGKVDGLGVTSTFDVEDTGI